jgi:acylphosphatase
VGWIRNTTNGSVRGEAQHKDQQKLDDFVRVSIPLDFTYNKWLGYEGSPQSKIDQCKIEKIEEVEGEKEFRKVKSYETWPAS